MESLTKLLEINVLIHKLESFALFKLLDFVCLGNFPEQFAHVREFIRMVELFFLLSYACILTNVLILIPFELILFDLKRKFEQKYEYFIPVKIAYTMAFMMKFWLY